MPPRVPRAEPDPVEDEVDDIIDDDDEEEEDSSNTVYESAEKLQEYNWQRREISEVIAMMSTTFLELNPDYQRDVVWSADRMTRLINSLICNYYIPPVIFNVETVISENGTKRFKRISVDGKQRLSSIREFVNGNIPCTDKNGRKWFFTAKSETGRVNKRVLDDKFKQRFLRLDILCVEYAALERRQEEDLFSRVQLGVPLTPAEKLRASSGTWQAFAIDIEKMYPQLMETVDNKRGRSFQLVLQIFKQILNSDEVSPKYSAGAAALKGFCERPNLLDETFKATARRVFRTYNDILRKHPETFINHSYSHATKYSPIEFVGAAILIHQHPQRNNATLLSGDILRMRSYLRSQRQDLRSNTGTWGCIIQFIEDLETFRGGANVIPRDKSNSQMMDTSMDDPGEGGSQYLPPPSARKPVQIKLETQFPAPTPQKRPPTTTSASQRPPSVGPYVQAPVSPLGQTAPRTVADRFRAVPVENQSIPLFRGSSEVWSDDGRAGGRSRSINEHSGRNDHIPNGLGKRNVDWGVPQKPPKREKGNY